MTVSKRSPRNKARRKFIGNGGPDDKFNRSRRWEIEKRKKAESLLRKQNRNQKNKDLRAKRAHFESRGVL